MAPFRSRTTHSAVNSQFSPTPNIVVTHAPTTGANDLRTVMPEIAMMFRRLQPIIDEMAILSEEVRYHFFSFTSKLICSYREFRV